MSSDSSSSFSNDLAFRYVGRKEAARILGFSVRTLTRRAKNDPTFPPTRRDGAIPSGSFLICSAGCSSVGRSGVVSTRKIGRPRCHCSAGSIFTSSVEARMRLPDYKLIGAPGRFQNGHGKLAKFYAQRFRLLSDPPRKVRSVSLATTDKAVARRRAVD